MVVDEPDRSEHQHNACTTTDSILGHYRIHPCGMFFQPLPEAEANHVNFLLINMEVTLLKCTLLPSNH